MTATALTKKDVLGLALAAGWRGQDAITAARVAWRETRGRPAQTNPEPVNGGCTGPGSRHATGLFQIVPACHPTFDAGRGLVDPIYNAEFAHGLWQRAGWGPWKQNGQTPPAGLDSSAGPESEWLRLLHEHYPNAQAVGVTELPGVVADAAGAVGIDDFAAMLTNPDTWRRVALVVGGAVLFALGLAAVSSDLGSPLRTVSNLVPAGQLAQLVKK